MNSRLDQAHSTMRPRFQFGAFVGDVFRLSDQPFWGCSLQMTHELDSPCESGNNQNLIIGPVFDYSGIWSLHVTTGREIGITSQNDQFSHILTRYSFVLTTHKRKSESIWKSRFTLYSVHPWWNEHTTNQVEWRPLLYVRRESWDRMTD